MRTLVVFGVVALSWGSARADELTTVRGEPVTEVAHSVAVTLAGGVTTYSVHREFLNRGRSADEMHLEITMPVDAVATGVRFKSRDHWDTATLLEDTKAAVAYRSAGGHGTDRVLLEWADRARLLLHAFPMLPGVTTIEYTLIAPTRYVRGSYWVDYARATGTCAENKPTRTFEPPMLTIDHDATVDGHAIGAGVATSLALPCHPDSVVASETQTVDIGIAPALRAPWDARLGRVVTSHEAFSRFEIDVAPRLSELPARAQLVFVVDASYSMGDAGLAAELDTIRAYAHHLPDAAIEVVVYRRRAARVFGTFVPAAQLDDRLRAAAPAFALGNGSALDAGTRLAAAALADRSGPRRIIVMTDENVRPALTMPVALASLSSLSPETVVHVVVPSVDPRGWFRRNDDEPLSALATSHHGIFAYLGLSPWANDVVLPLVRPTTIDRLSAAGIAVPTSVAEGTGVQLFSEASAVPARVIIVGQLWSDPIERVVDVDADSSRSTAAFMIATQKTIGLDREDQMMVALACEAVSPVTSYVVAGSRRPPQRAGDDHGVEGGVCGCEVRGMVPGILGSPPPGPPRVRPELAAMIDARACHATRDVELVIDTTGDEIVDVAIRGTVDPMSTCVADAAWLVRLDKRFDAMRDQFTVVVRPR